MKIICSKTSKTLSYSVIFSLQLLNFNLLNSFTSFHFAEIIKFNVIYKLNRALG